MSEEMEAIEEEMEQLKEYRQEMATLMSGMTDGQLPEDPDAILDQFTEDSEHEWDGTVTIEVPKFLYSPMMEAIEAQFTQPNKPAEVFLYSSLFLEIVEQDPEAFGDIIEVVDEETDLRGFY